MIAYAATAQTFMDNVRTEIQTKIQHLNPNDVPTRILYDRTLPLSNILGYGTPSGFAPLVPSVPNSNAGHYFLAMEDLYRMDYLNRFTNPETLITNNQTASNIINIGFINADINKFKDDALDIGALIVQGNDSLFYDNPNSSLSPYNEYKNIFVASSLKKKTTLKSIYFKLPSVFWKETAQYSISSLQIDFNDGVGYRTVVKNQTYYIQYAAYGNKDISIKATFSNNATKTVTSVLEIVSPNDEVLISETMSTLPSNCAIPVTQVFSSAPYTFQGYDEGQAYVGIGRYANHSNTTCVDKPIIVVEGYDPADTFDNDDIFGTAQLNRNGLSTDLVNNDYDVITLNFEPRPINGKTVAGGTDYIERNAMVLVKLITFINQNKSTNAEPTKVIGFSMGGVIARYALRYMELNSLTHDVDLYASVDAPHQGATVPRGAQEMIDFVDDVVPNWGEDYEEFSEIGENLENPAVKQLLSNHYNSSTFHNTFYGNLSTMGYPQNSRNIAVVNGSFYGNGTSDINQKYFEGKAHLLWVLIDGNIRLKFTNNSGNARVFNWRLKLLGVTVWHRQRYSYTNPSMGSLENAPGGIATLETLDKDILELTELGFDWFVAGMDLELSSDKFSFIPTKSALDYQGDPHLYEDINRNLVCTNNTPFNSYHSAPSTNEPHTFLSSTSSYYLFEEIEGNPQDPYPGGTGTYPSGGTYKVDPPIGITYTLLTGGGNNTLLGDPDPLNLPAAQKVTVRPNMPTGASNPTWTVWADNDNSLDSWSSGGSTLTFYYMNKNFNSVIDFRFTITDECGNPQFTPVRFVIVEDGGRPQPIESFVVYPVPAKNMITIVNTQSENTAITAILYDMFGQEKTSHRAVDNNSLTLDVGYVPEGIYILKIIGNNGIEVIKHLNIEK
ncbi:T9SS type A sorting domain-containing protein [Aequorivita capsosiphonis]|uniref:T9SS type A sorting domain-containing protein n=1 Tax=Aequorivita capsosiphonis TaxID=487317 RepID=UPI000415F94E|nr:T9SS type A sorting domain-containing protein [Aequorivita capsosiphonis]